MVAISGNKWHLVENEFATLRWHNGGIMVKVCLNTPPIFHSLVAFSVKKVELTGKLYNISPAQIFHHFHDLGGVLVVFWWHYWWKIV